MGPSASNRSRRALTPPSAAQPPPQQAADEEGDPLRAYERLFLYGNPNMSADSAPIPTHLMKPPPRPVTYWVVVAGEKVGLCTDIGDIDFSRIVLLPQFAIYRFTSWSEAIKFYAEEFDQGRVRVLKYADFGKPDKPIRVGSAFPTPAVPKITRFTLPLAPADALAPVVRAPARRATPKPTSEPTTPQSMAVNLSSDIEHLVYPESPSVGSPVGSDEPSNPFSQPGDSEPPARRGKRALPNDQRAQSPTEGLLRSPVLHATRTNKKARATSKPTTPKKEDGRPSKKARGVSQPITPGNEDDSDGAYLPLYMTAEEEVELNAARISSIDMLAAAAAIRREDDDDDDREPSLPRYLLFPSISTATASSSKASSSKASASKASSSKAHPAKASSSRSARSTSQLTK